MQGDIVSGVLLPLILGFIMFSLGLGLTPVDFRRILAAAACPAGGGGVPLCAAAAGVLPHA